MKRSVLTCIFSSLPAALLDVPSGQQCGQMICTLHQRCLSIRYANHTRFSAGCLRNWQLGSAITMGMSWAYPATAVSSGLQGIECHAGKQPGPDDSPATTAKDSFGHSAAFSGRVRLIRLAGGHPGVVCTSSTLLQLYLVRQWARVQCFPQGGVPCVHQHV
jgi:hypothetical protein